MTTDEIQDNKDRGKDALVTLGQRVRELRLAKGMTQTELAEGLVTPSMISQIENGISLPSYMTTAKLAKRLGTTVYELYEGLTFSKMQLAGYRHALSQMSVGHYIPALSILEELHNEELLHFEISPDELQLNLGVCCREIKRYEESAGLIETLIQRLSYETGRTDNVHLLINAYMELSRTNERMERYFEALRAVMDAKDVYEKHQSPDPFLQGKILMRLADLNKRLHRFEEAQRCYDQALRVYGQLSDDLTQIGPIYQRLAEVYAHQQNMDMMIEFANKAIMALQAAELVVDYREAKRLLVKEQVSAENWKATIAVLLNLASFYARNDILTQADIYLDVAEIHQSFDDTEESFKYCMMALSLLNDRYPHHLKVGRANFLLGTVYDEKGELDSAIQSLELAVNIFKRHGQLNDLDLATRQLCMLYKKQGRPEKAFDVFDDAHHFILEQLKIRGVIV